MSSEFSYKSIVKSMAVFGGAQIVQMVVTIFRSKFIAVFLGSQGMGLNAIFQSSISVITTFSSFGIFQSAVRDISQAHEVDDQKKLNRTVVIFSKIVLLTGLLGMIICFLGSPLLSKFAFNSFDNTWYFALISISFLFTALANGKITILQGTRNINYLARSSMIGAILSLATSIPLFIYFGVTGIVISIISSSIIIYLTQSYFTKKVYAKKSETLHIGEIISEGKPIVKLGSVLMFSTLMIAVFTYLTNIFIGRYGRIEDIGLFQSVSAIIMQSIAIVNTVMASDFFPRLSAIYQDKIKVKNLVNHQAEMISLIIAPIIILLLTFTPLIVKLLLSDSFLIVVPMLRLMALSLLIRGIWLTLVYIILARGDRKIYFMYDAFIGNGLLFLLNILAYYFWGLQGLGYSFLAGTIIISTILYVVVKVKYDFSFNSEFVKLFFFLIFLSLSSFATMLFLNGWIQYVLSSLIILVMLSFSILVLNKRIGFFQMIKSKF